MLDLKELMCPFSSAPKEIYASNIVTFTEKPYVGWRLQMIACETTHSD